MGISALEPLTVTIAFDHDHHNIFVVTSHSKDISID